MNRLSLLIEFAFVDWDFFAAYPACESSHDWLLSERLICTRDRPSGGGGGRLCKKHFSKLVKWFFTQSNYDVKPRS
jgi:hypothetical protein